LSTLHLKAYPDTSSVIAEQLTMRIFSFVPDILIFEMSPNFILFFSYDICQVSFGKCCFLKINAGLYAQYNPLQWNLAEL
jgi:hypothetical protein